jgi:transcriptional regulator with XRE-family HTH domain
MDGYALKLIRQFYSIKQSELAKDLGISNSYLSEIESGNKEVTLSLLKKYADHFDIPMSSLMLFAENIEDKSISGKFKTSFASKLKQIMEWVVAKDNHLGAKKM